MKKLLSLILALCLSAAPLAALAVDLSGLTSDELIELRGQILTELKSRGDLIYFDVPVGYYIVGVDLPAGDYYVTPSSSSYTNVSLYPNAESDRLQWYAFVDPGETARVTLVEGEKIEVSHAPAHFEIYTGITINIDK